MGKPTKKKSDLPKPKPNKPLPNGSIVQRPANGGRTPELPVSVPGCGLWVDWDTDGDVDPYGAEPRRQDIISHPDILHIIKDQLDNTN